MMFNSDGRGNRSKKPQKQSSMMPSKQPSQPYYPASKPSYFSSKSNPVKNAVVPQSINTPQQPQAIHTAFVKVPVVLGETTVQIDMDAKIKFPEPVLEIKQIKKNLKLTQCRLLLPTNKLFLKGFVRKNIQYATPKQSSKHTVLSEIHSLTVDIPFETVTEIDFINMPQFNRNPRPSDFTFFSSSPLPQGFSQKEHLLSADFSQFDQISGEVYNELPYCELLSSQFIEYDEALNREMGMVYDASGDCLEAPFEEGTFTKVEEKMVVELTLKVLQNQQVQISGQAKSDNQHDHC